MAQFFAEYRPVEPFDVLDIKHEVVLFRSLAHRLGQVNYLWHVGRLDFPADFYLLNVRGELADRDH
ncbi:hypothetical protein GRI69_13495 [Erythrobacter vulgaris]|uniref:Uncharacterized protein n=1 Tax=Qipengyuania vulgaris TaxID=291985 RepID=A0A844XWE3_9SPHN|nr:hypothetical protein [Qipengyuania vulgaris]MXO49268.1 hypothetical protein [Qipengyuania vulgaris]